MPSLHSIFTFGQWFGIASEYIVATGLIVGGAYLAAIFNLAAANPLAWLVRPLRFLGGGLVGCGIVLASFTYGKTVGATDFEARWEAANYEARLARARQEAEAEHKAAEFASEQAKQLEALNAAQQQKISAYEETVRNAPSCRLATPDDDRRLCDIIGGAAPGCPHSK